METDGSSRDQLAVELALLRRRVGELAASERRRRWAEEALREGEERYRAVVEQTAEGLFLLDTCNRRVLESNPALQRLLGYTAEELHGMELYELVSHDRRSVDLYVQRVLAEGKCYVGERQYRRKDGSLVDVEVRASVISYGGSGVICAVVLDLTERRRAERSLREIREAERRRIAADLHDVTLQDLSYALQEVQLARDGPDAEERLQKAAEALRRSVGGLRDAVYDLRLEAVHRQTFARSLRSLIELNRQKLPDGSEIELEVEGEVEGGAESEIPANVGGELLRILQESLTNARRHSAAVNVRVSLRRDGRELRMEVADDGLGFEPEATWSGVGLAGMRERALTIGAELAVESAPGEGARVIVSVPARLLDGAAAESYLGPDHAGPEDATEASVSRILLVEDHVSLRQALASVLDGEPDLAVAAQAGSLAEARSLAGGGFDVAVVDLVLPDGNGAELIWELREASPRVLVLCLTASLDPMDFAWAVEAGADGILHKSAPMEEVVGAVRRLAGGGGPLATSQAVEMLRLASHQRQQEHEAALALKQLTAREKEVLQSLADGLSDREIAHRLNVTLATEHTHMMNILTKLGVHSRLEALVYAIRHGGVEIGPTRQV